MFWKRYRRDRAAVLGLVLVAFVLLLVIFGPAIAPSDPVEQNLANRRKPPNTVNVFGTDAYGRDILSRILFGARTTFIAGVSVVLSAMLIGLVLGVLSGYFGGLTDTLVMRAMDFILAFPTFFLAILIVAILGPSLGNAIIAVTVTAIPQYARVVRSSTLSLKSALYVEAARAIGASSIRIIIEHIIPNLIGPIIVLGTVGLGGAVIMVAALSFLGMGAQPPTPEWGLMLSEGRSYVTSDPYMVLIPGVFLVVFVLGFNLVGDGLRDVLDPRLK